MNREERNSLIGTMTTLCYLEKDDSYLMLHRVKKKVDVNKDKWIGIGGKFEKDESPEECLLREAKEETGTTLTSFRLRGVITFVIDDLDEYTFLYTADGFEGQPIPCTEGDLQWIEKEKIGSLPLWEGDKLFFRLLEERQDVFSLKLTYIHDALTAAAVDGREISLEK